MHPAAGQPTVVTGRSPTGRPVPGRRSADRLKHEETFVVRNDTRLIQTAKHLIRIALVAAFLWVAAGNVPTAEAGTTRMGEEIPTLTRG